MTTNIREFQGKNPLIETTAFIDHSAIIIGQVSIGKNSSIWCNTVLRGDVSHISIGYNTNIQDLTIVHVTHYNPNSSIGDFPVQVGNNVTIGHNCCIHACTIKNNVLVGMGTTILDNSIIEEKVFIGAGSLVPPNKVLESGYLYFGNPVKKIRLLTLKEIEHLQYSADHYVKLAQLYKNNKK